MGILRAFVLLALSWAVCLPALAPSVNSAGYQHPAIQQGPEGLRPVQRLETIFIARETAGTLFENVVAVLEKKYHDQRFRTEVLPSLVSKYREKAARATTLGEQRDLVQEFLSHIPASHLGLLSKNTHRYIMYDLQNLPYPNFGFQLINVKGKYYAFFVLEGGPAVRAGLLAWDRIVSIDGVPVERSPRLDWRSDDAYISDDRDPPVHLLIAGQGDTARIKVERSPGKFLDLTIASEDYTTFDAARASSAIVRR